jgi:hypothetical protein
MVDIFGDHRRSRPRDSFYHRSQVLSRLRQKNLHTVDARLRPRARVPARADRRAAGALAGLRATCCSRSAITTSRCGASADEATGRRPGRRLGHRAIPRWQRVPRQPRPPAAPLVLLPRRGVPAVLPRPAGRADPGGHGEVEFHLHHDGDTAATLAPAAAKATCAPSPQHGHISRVAARARAAFAGPSSTATGAWPTAGPIGAGAASTTSCRSCSRLGCYADFTFPSAPDPCQPDVVNADLLAASAT